MDLSVRSMTTQVEKRDWLASDFGTAEPRGITLNIALFTAGTHYPNGFIPSGVFVAKVTATGLYGPYDDAAVDGRAVCAGPLFSNERAVNPLNGVALAKVGAALMEMGLIVESKLPTGHGLDAAAKVDLVNWFKFL